METSNDCTPANRRTAECEEQISVRVGIVPGQSPGPLSIEEINKTCPQTGEMLSDVFGVALSVSLDVSGNFLLFVLHEWSRF